MKRVRIDRIHKPGYDSTMSKRRIQLGREGESIMDEALRNQGFTIEARNWRCAVGEVDLIATRNTEWYFVEVRTRHGAKSISPEEGLTFRKRERMEKVARFYLGQHAGSGDIIWHLSFAAVILNPTGTLQRITLYLDLESDGQELLC